jgi:hypothetical protein
MESGVKSAVDYWMSGLEGFVQRFLREISNPRMIFSCRIPDDWIDNKRYPLFMARSVMRSLIEQLEA